MVYKKVEECTRELFEMKKEMLTSEEMRKKTL